MCELTLSGVVEGMALLASRAPGRQRDAVILAFRWVHAGAYVIMPERAPLRRHMSSLYICGRDAKVAVLDWDALTHAVVTTSLHSFEGDRALPAGSSGFLRAPRLVADPQVTASGAQVALPQRSGNLKPVHAHTTTAWA